MSTVKIIGSMPQLVAADLRLGITGLTSGRPVTVLWTDDVVAQAEVIATASLTSAVVVIVDESDADNVLVARRNGALGAVVHRSDHPSWPMLMTLALQAASLGQTFTDPYLATVEPARTSRPDALLSPAEREVARLLARHLANEDICAATGKSMSTVKSTVSAIRAKAKLPGRNRAELSNWCRDALA